MAEWRDSSIDRQLSMPRKSAMLRGPIGTSHPIVLLHPSFMAWSMSATLAMPSEKTKTASFIQGNRIRAEIKPGRSREIDVSFPSFSAILSEVRLLNGFLDCCLAGLHSSDYFN